MGIPPAPARESTALLSSVPLRRLRALSESVLSAEREGKTNKNKSNRAQTTSDKQARKSSREFLCMAQKGALGSISRASEERPSKKSAAAFRVRKPTLVSEAPSQLAEEVSSAFLRSKQPEVQGRRNQQQLTHRQQQKAQQKQTGKKTRNKKLPTEVSSRRPYYVSAWPQALPLHCVSAASASRSTTEPSNDRQQPSPAASEVSPDGASRPAAALAIQQGFRDISTVAAAAFVSHSSGEKTGSSAVVADIVVGRERRRRELALQRRLKALRTRRLQMKRSNNVLLQNGAASKNWARDPRFSDACGPLDIRMVGKAYAFLNDMRKQEAAELKRIVQQGRAKAATGSSGIQQQQKFVKVSEEEREAAKKALQRLRSEEAARTRKAIEMKVKQQLALAEKEKIVQTGKRPFFTKRKERRMLVQAELQRRRHAASGMPGKRTLAKQEERSSRKATAKERKKGLMVPLRRFVEE